MDIWDKKKRSEVMSKIRSKNTKPEMTLRKALFAKGYRYRINYKKLSGKPDIAFPKYKTAIFVHGCFWHGQVEHSRHRSPANFLMNLLAALAAYCFFPKKPSIRFEREKSNQLTFFA